MQPLCEIPYSRIGTQNNMFSKPTYLQHMSLPDKIEWYEKLLWLITKDVIFLSTYDQLEDKHDGHAHPFVFASDTFVYACADGEELFPEDIDMLNTLFEKYSWDGVIAMLAAKRKVKPLEQLRTPEYYSALQLIGVDDSGFKDYYAEVT